MPVDASHRFSNELRRRGNTHVMQRQLTPAYVLDPVREELGGTIGLDPCTEPDNPTQAQRFYTSSNDGLAQDWDADTIYANPPYGEARGAWVARAQEAAADGARVVMLIPAHTDTRIFQSAMATATAIVFVKGRVKFGVLRDNRRQEAASHPSALIGWNTSLAACAHLGTLVTLRAEDDDRSVA